MNWKSGTIGWTGFILATAITLQGLGQDLPDYRNQKESCLKVSNKAIREDLVTFMISGSGESIGKTPLRKLTPDRPQKGLLTFTSPALQAAIRIGPFEPSSKKLLFEEKLLVKINGKPYHGDYGYIPHLEIKKITLLIDKDTVAIPPAAYSDLYNLNLFYRDGSGQERSSHAIYFSADGSRIYLYLLNRDQSGSYEVTWIIENKTYLRRVVDYGFTR